MKLSKSCLHLEERLTPRFHIVPGFWPVGGNGPALIPPFPGLGFPPAGSNSQQSPVVYLAIKHLQTIWLDGRYLLCVIAPFILPIRLIGAPSDSQANS